MAIWLKRLWYFSVIYNSISLIWFYLGSTANFQRSFGLVNGIILRAVWAPSVLLVCLSIFLLLRGWIPSSLIGKITIWVLVALLLYNATGLFSAVDIRGWLHDRIDSEPLKVTEDGKYQYRIEFVNLGQKNRRAQLYGRELSTNKEMYISVEIDKELLKSLPRGPGNDWSWTVLTPTSKVGQYELVTTRTLSIPQHKFLIEMQEGVSVKVE